MDQAGLSRSLLCEPVFLGALCVWPIAPFCLFLLLAPLSRCAGPGLTAPQYSDTHPITKKPYTIDVGYERFLGPEIFFHPEVRGVSCSLAVHFLRYSGTPTNAFIEELARLLEKRFLFFFFLFFRKIPTYFVALLTHAHSSRTPTSRTRSRTRWTM
jgi:hypothetical protein